MREIKYIAYIHEGMEKALMFSDSEQHREIYRGIAPVQIIGAGFCRLTTKKDTYGDKILIVECYGDSVSLNVKSRGQYDADILQKMYFGFEYQI